MGQEEGAQTPPERRTAVLCWGCGQVADAVVCAHCIGHLSEGLTILQNIMGGFRQDAR